MIGTVRFELVEIKRGFGQMVMPAALLFIDQYPPEAEAEKCPGNERRDKAQGGLTPADRIAVIGQNFDFPGAHAEGLAAVGPEPGKKQKADADQVERIEKLLGRERNARVERQYRGGRDEQDRDEQECIINDGRQSAEEAGRGIGARQRGSSSWKLQLFEWGGFLAEIQAAASQRAQHQ